MLDLCMTARALGASDITFTCRKSPKLVDEVRKLNWKWGGKFDVHFTDNYRKHLDSVGKNYKLVYLTRFGTPLSKISYPIKTYKNLVLIITEREGIETIQKLADFNVSVSSQPHASISALAIFLHTFYNGRELAIRFGHPHYRIS